MFNEINLSKQEIYDKIKTYNIELTDYQLEGVDFMLSRKNVLNADDMGLGKTYQSMATAILSEAKRICIIAPASLIATWINDGIKPFGLLKELQTAKGKDAKIFQSKKILLASYEWATKNYKKIIDYNPELFIIDEAHYLKNDKSKRTQSMLELREHFKNIKFILLTGTPISNEIEDLSTLFSLLQLKNVKQIEKDIKDTVKAIYGKTIKKEAKKELIKNMLSKEVKDRIDGVVIRRKKDKILNLKGKLKRLIYMEMNDEDKAKYDEIVKTTKKIGFGTKFRQLTGEIKIHYIADIIQMLLDKGLKPIIFINYKKASTEIKKKFPIAYLINGSVPKGRRQEILKQFKESKKPNILIVSLKTGSTGLNIQESNDVVFLELDWNPATLKQAEDRAYRKGQTDTVYVYYFVLTYGDPKRKTIEEEMFDKLKLKDNDFNYVFNETDNPFEIKAISKKSLIDELLERFAIEDIETKVTKTETLTTFDVEDFATEETKERKHIQKGSDEYKQHKKSENERIYDALKTSISYEELKDFRDIFDANQTGDFNITKSANEILEKEQKKLIELSKINFKGRKATDPEIAKTLAQNKLMLKSLTLKPTGIFLIMYDSLEQEATYTTPIRDDLSIGALKDVIFALNHYGFNDLARKFFAFVTSFIISYEIDLSQQTLFAFNGYSLSGYDNSKWYSIINQMSRREAQNILALILTSIINHHNGIDNQTNFEFVDRMPKVNHSLFGDVLDYYGFEDAYFGDDSLGDDNKAKKSPVDIVLDELIRIMEEKQTLLWYEPNILVKKSNPFNHLKLKKPPVVYKGYYYKGLINKMMLATASDDFFLTFQQIKELGGSVKKGAEGIMILFSFISNTDNVRKGMMIIANNLSKDELLSFFGIEPNNYQMFKKGSYTLSPKQLEKLLEWLKPFDPTLAKAIHKEIVSNKIQFKKLYYNVFALSDTEGIDRKNIDSFIKTHDFKPLESAEAFINRLRREKGLVIKHQGSDRFYSPSEDYIQIPYPERFYSKEHYYSTLFHELIHWTASRLGRTIDVNFGSEKYGFEELIAEMGSSLLKMHFGIWIEELKENDSAYIKSWLKTIKADKQMLFQAISFSEKALKYLGINDIGTMEEQIIDDNGYLRQIEEPSLLSTVPYYDDELIPEVESPSNPCMETILNFKEYLNETFKKHITISYPIKKGNSTVLLDILFDGIKRMIVEMECGSFNETQRVEGFLYRINNKSKSLVRSAFILPNNYASFSKPIIDEYLKENSRSSNDKLRLYNEITGKSEPEKTETRKTTKTKTPRKELTELESIILDKIDEINRLYRESPYTFEYIEENERYSLISHNNKAKEHNEIIQNMTGKSFIERLDSIIKDAKTIAEKKADDLLKTLSRVDGITDITKIWANGSISIPFYYNGRYFSVYIYPKSHILVGSDVGSNYFDAISDAIRFILDNTVYEEETKPKTPAERKEKLIEILTADESSLKTSPKSKKQIELDRQGQGYLFGDKIASAKRKKSY